MRPTGTPKRRSAGWPGTSSPATASATGWDPARRPDEPDSQPAMFSVPCRFVLSVEKYGWWYAAPCSGPGQRPGPCGGPGRARWLDGGVLLGGLGAASSHAGCDRGGLEAFDDQIDAQRELPQGDRDGKEPRQPGHLRPEAE